MFKSRRAPALAGRGKVCPMSLETFVETWPAIPTAAPYESARPDNDQLMRRLATGATALAAAAAILLVGMSAVVLGMR